MTKKFKGTINVDIQDSVPDWAPDIQPTAPDAEGLVVSPGFIDCHVHTVDLPMGQKLMLRGGVHTRSEVLHQMKQYLRVQSLRACLPCLPALC